MIDVDAAVCGMELLFLYLNVHFTISLPMYTIKFNFLDLMITLQRFLDWIYYIRAATNYSKSFYMYEIKLHFYRC